MNYLKLPRLRPRWQVLVDFDGTIAPSDPTDRILERFADPTWLVVEAAWQSGRISSSVCMQRQVELLRATPEELDEEIAKVRLDPAFPVFLEFCRQLDADVKIVSDGFDRVIAAALRNAELEVPFFANRLEWQGGDRWRLTFPHWRDDCRVGGANCKCSHRARPTMRPLIVVGDGRSDMCMSERADYVIAKGTLARHCRSRGQEHATFTDFEDVTAHLAKWLVKDVLTQRTMGPARARPEVRSRQET
jgi:2,3-diketo-5-methylthio-1-phosphopentane phosphatase